MNGLTRLHTIATARGDGLRPELLALFQRQHETARHPKVVVLRLHDRTQAGPSPTGVGMSDLPDGVLAFPARPCTNFHHASKRKL
jgi:hypothetical protein